MKGSHPEKLNSAHLYLNIAKSGYFFRGYSGGMGINHFVKYFWTILINFVTYIDIFMISVFQCQNSIFAVRLI